MDLDLDYDAAKRGARFPKGLIFISVKTASQRDLIVANVFPKNLVPSNGHVSATVTWEGVDTFLSLVRLLDAADLEPWDRCIQLVEAVVGPKNAPVHGQFDAQNWMSVQLSMPVVDGNLENRALVTLDKASWRGKFLIDDGRRANLEFVIPVHFRELDAGSLLYEICQLLLPPK